MGWVQCCAQWGVEGLEGWLSGWVQWGWVGAVVGAAGRWAGPGGWLSDWEQWLTGGGGLCNEWRWVAGWVGGWYSTGNGWSSAGHVGRGQRLCLPGLPTR